MKRITPENFLSQLRERVLVFDGAMGSNLQQLGLTDDDFGGKDGCNEALNLFSPQSVRKIHSSFLGVGCRGIETNTFGATRIVLREYGLEEQVAKINHAAVKIAREALEQIPSDQPRFIGGALGPTSRIPSLGQISFDEMAGSFAEQVQALVDAGVDLLLIETCQDLLQAKAALHGAMEVFRREGFRLPIVVSVTIEPTGAMLVGTDIGAVQAILEPFPWIDVIGINCATGPLEMARHVKFLARNTRKTISVMPNAGLPENVAGKAVYRLLPEDLARFHQEFVLEYGVSIVGGCCGTAPSHLAAVVKRIGEAKPAERKVNSTAVVASLYSAASLHQDPPPCIIGERTNANGSRHFRELLLNDDLDGMIALGKDQARGGAHLLDLSTAYVGRDERADFAAIVPQFARQVKLPLLIDSTDPGAIEVALKSHAGRCIVNSVNFEDGGKKLRQVAALAKDFGAALVCLAIDEEGMARTFHRKIKIIDRLYKTLTEEFQFEPYDLIFDPLTFTIGSGDPDLRSAAVETLRALSELKSKFPETSSLLGVSNVSFGLAPDSRKVLNSVFLHEAVSRGLSMAIVQPTGIVPTFKIPDEQKGAALDLLLNKSGDGSDLARYLGLFKSDVRVHSAQKPNENLSPAETLFRKVMDGDKTRLSEAIQALLKTVKPEEIVNDHLIKAMRAVGELFGKGEMQLPFVLQSAEVVKAAVGFLEPMLDKKTSSNSYPMILATVSGDVHDIGKNLVNILLSNNGYKVIDLGSKVDIDTMIRAAKENNTDILGMSGLLVRSTQVMREDLAELNRRGLPFTVLLGGAALTRDYVETQLRAEFHGQVFYARDAFDGLTIMDSITRSRPKKNPATSIEPASKPQKNSGCQGVSCEIPREDFPPEPLFEREKISPPFWGAKDVEVGLEDLIRLLEPQPLFQARWKFHQGKMDDMEYRAMIDRDAKPALDRLLDEMRKRSVVRPRARYGYFSCKSDGDCIVVKPVGGKRSFSWEFPRSSQSAGVCLSDFVSKRGDDSIVLWAVTVGQEAEDFAKMHFKQDRYKDYLFWTGLLAELTDCGAEFIQRWVTEEIQGESELKRISEAGWSMPCRGKRFSFGYPACPELSFQKQLLKALNAESIGIAMTENYQMVPENSVSGLLFLNEAAHYFSMLIA